MWFPIFLKEGCMPRGFVWWGVFLMVLAVPVTVQAQGFPGSLMGKVGCR